MSLRDRIGSWFRGLPDVVPSGPPGGAVAFGYKCSWLAIRDASPERVIAAVPVRHGRPTSWGDGIAAAYRGDVFVTPPLDRWVLVVSTALPSWGDYAYLGEQGLTVVDVGETTEAEQELGLDLSSDSSPDGGRDADGDGRDHPDEETVMQLAGKWSIDPLTLEEFPVAPIGWVGTR
jgi:hypothetical protein